MKTDYSSVRLCFPARVVPGKPKTEIDASDRIKLTRVTEEGRDSLFVGGGMPRPVEIPWSNVACATRAEVKPAEKEKTK